MRFIALQLVGYLSQYFLNRLRDQDELRAEKNRADELEIALLGLMVHGCEPVKTVRGRVTEWEELARIANAIVKEQSANLLSRRVARRAEHRETEGDMQAVYWI